MEKKVYLTPQVNIIHTSHEDVMKQTSWTPDGTTKIPIKEGNPDSNEEDYYAKSHTFSVWDE